MCAMLLGPLLTNEIAGLPSRSRVLYGLVAAYKNF